MTHESYSVNPERYDERAAFFWLHMHERWRGLAPCVLAVAERKRSAAGRWRGAPRGQPSSSERPPTLGGGPTARSASVRLAERRGDHAEPRPGKLSVAGEA